MKKKKNKKEKGNEENKKLLNKFMETIFYHQILIDLKIHATTEHPVSTCTIKQ